MSSLSTSATSRPRVSVLVSVCNGLPYLRAAIESVLAQTLADFEFIVIDDGSTDGSGAVIDQYAERDRRLRVVHQQNRGLIASLNRGMDLVRGEYVARMDADDISLHHRLELQVSFMNAHPNCVGVGGAAEIIGPAGKPQGVWAPPVHPAVIRWQLLSGNCLIHPTMLLRSDAVREVGGYDHNALHAEDYALWVALAKRGDLHCLDAPLIRKRDWPGRITRSHSAVQEETVLRIVRQAFAGEAGGMLPARAASLLRLAVGAATADPADAPSFSTQDVAQLFERVRAVAIAQQDRCSEPEVRGELVRRADDLLWAIAQAVGGGARWGVLGPAFFYATRHPGGWCRRIKKRVLS